MLHELKILPEYFKEVISGRKTFELRKNDRNFQVGDKVLLKEWNLKEYTGRECEVMITYILHDYDFFGLEKDYCIFSFIRPVSCRR